MVRERVFRTIRYEDFDFRVILRKKIKTKHKTLSQAVKNFSKQNCWRNTKYLLEEILLEPLWWFSPWLWVIWGKHDLCVNESTCLSRRWHLRWPFDRASCSSRSEQHISMVATITQGKTNSFPIIPQFPSNSVFFHAICFPQINGASLYTEFVFLNLSCRSFHIVSLKMFYSFYLLIIPLGEKCKCTIPPLITF